MMKTDAPFSGHVGFPVSRRIFRAGSYEVPVFERTHIMGILNVTPDSFSDGGQFACIDKAVSHAIEMASLGADIIDIGGESTRPDHTPVTAETEMNRVLPVIRALSSRLSIPISVDTWKASVAEAAVLAGASIINDVWGAQRDPDVARVAALSGSGLILMFNAFDDLLVHKSGNIVADAMDFLRESIRIAHQAGVPDQQIMIDSGSQPMSLCS
jgi:dihydropteroate synthase